MGTSDLETAEMELRVFALALPGAWEDFPWGERVVKVGKKVFVFLNIYDGGLNVSTKLPVSAGPALAMPFARPTGYGLGKAGWVSARFEAGESPPVGLLREWIEESYRAIAPKKLAAGLGR
jgi:predicted DNA-binding protein (MmcQ/YjbR family)